MVRTGPRALLGRVGHDIADMVAAGWSSPVARQAHNLKVIGSNPIPATRKARQVKDLAGFFVAGGASVRTPEALGEQEARSCCAPERKCLPGSMRDARVFVASVASLSGQRA
jgi:hypothetical protein